MRTLLRNVRNPLWSAAALFIVVSGMREAKVILMPIALAAMMAVICSPMVGWLRRRRVPNVMAVVAVVALIMLVLAGIGALVGVSVSGFEESIPRYRDRLATMVYGVFAWLSHNGIELNTEELVKGVDLQGAAEKAGNFMVDSVSKLGGVISNSFLVGLTMVLILIEGPTVPGKLRALAGAPDADISQFNRIAQEVQSYLAIKSVLSLATGVIVGLWAWFLGVDFAALWGLLAFLLNYIPNIGSILAAVPAMMLALVQHGVGTSLWLGAGYVAVNMVLGNVIEPMWMGRKLGLSTTVVFVSLVVWNWIWGPVGMLLSVPLTMIIKIMLQNSKDWSFIATMLDNGEEVADEEPETRAPKSKVRNPKSEIRLRDPKSKVRDPKSEIRDPGSETDSEIRDPTPKSEPDSEPDSDSDPPSTDRTPTVDDD
jgi:AI-2 transport protein TqsA